MSDKTHFTVVRNQGYTSTEFKTRQRHNERQNENYYNGDIISERSVLNVSYHHYASPDGTPETYEHTFERLLYKGEIVKRGLKPDAKVFAELVFGVNTTYFEERGGYDYAVEFFEEAYRMAIKEVGDEKYILSAVLHADERNKELSEQHGRDIFHYHLHVVYIPVVQKEVYYRKDMKDKEKAGTLKEVIPQISHSKKWPIKTPVERNGKTITVNSYSLLQDRFYEHMTAAGFPNLQRGERGSTAEHLEVLDFKIQQDKKRLDTLDEQVEKKEARLDKLDEKIAVKEKAKATITEVEAIGKPALLGGFNITDDELKKLKILAKKSVGNDNRAAEYKKKIAALDDKIRDLSAEVTALASERSYWKKKFDDLERLVKPFLSAIYNFPEVLKEFIARHWQERQQQKTNNREERS